MLALIWSVLLVLYLGYCAYGLLSSLYLIGVIHGSVRDAPKGVAAFFAWLALFISWATYPVMGPLAAIFGRKM